MKTIKLTSRNQVEISNPSTQDIEKVLEELFSVNDPEHPNAWIQLGFDSEDGWSIISIDAYESGFVIYEYWADQDDDDAKIEKRFHPDTTQTKKMFDLLANQEIEKINEIISNGYT